jgi:hypothetical protein
LLRLNIGASCERLSRYADRKSRRITVHK